MTEVKEKLLDREKFTSWLNAQPPGRHMPSATCDRCPLATYLHDTYAGEASVGVFAYSLFRKESAVHDHILPLWAHRFAKFYDQTHGKVASDARVILEAMAPNE